MHMSRDLGSLAVCAGAYPQPDVFVYVRSHKTGRHQALQGLSTRVRVVVKLSESQVAVSLWQVQADDGRRGVSIESDLDTWERDFFSFEAPFSSEASPALHRQNMATLSSEEDFTEVMLR